MRGGPCVRPFAPYYRSVPPSLINSILILATMTVVYAVGRRAGKYRTPIENLADGFLDMRQRTIRAGIRRPPRPGDVPAPLGRALDAMSAQLAGIDATVLGDSMTIDDTGKAYGPERWFTAAGGTICGWIGIARPDGLDPKPAGFFFTESDSGRFYVTGMQMSTVSLAHPPYESRLSLPAGIGLAPGFRRHQEFIERDLGNLTRISSLDEALALMDRSREREAAWRATCPAPWLLEHDLRAFFGDRFDDVGPRILRKLKGRV
jgi:hypothetical protein